MNLEELRDAGMAGAEAARAGKSRKDCPYRSEAVGVAKSRWLRGFDNHDKYPVRRLT